jgi:hypothetical protein
MKFFSKPTVVALIILLFIIPLVLFLFRGNQSNTPISEPTPVVTQTAKTIASVTQATLPSPTISQQLDKPVAQNDQAVKEKLLTDILHGTTVSGVVYSSPTIQIEYVAAADLFQGEVKTTAIDAGKNEAVQWMVKKGFSKQGLCDLPLIFYLNTSISQTLPDKGADFNSLPDGC